MLHLCLSPVMFYPSVYFIFKEYILLRITYLPTLHVRISVIYLSVLLTSPPDLLMLENHDQWYIKKSRPSLRLNSFSIFGAMLRNWLKPDLRKLRKILSETKFTIFFTVWQGSSRQNLGPTWVVASCEWPRKMTTSTVAWHGEPHRNLKWLKCFKSNY